MVKKRRIDIRGILAYPDLRRELMVPTIQATQAREGIETTRNQAERAYYVVTEGERTAFFDLERFRGGKGEPDRRQEMFVRALRDEGDNIRFDVARRDFGTIEGSPLAYRRVGLVAHIFRDHSTLLQVVEAIEQGVASINIDRYARCWWEISIDSIARTNDERSSKRPWARFAKGGDFSRFYADVYLVMFIERDWETMRAEINRRYPYLKGNTSLVIHPENHYFKPGLTWPYRTQRGYSPRMKPADSIHGHVGHSLFAKTESDSLFLLGVLTSIPFEFLVGLFSAFGKYEIGMLKKCPVPLPAAGQRERLSKLARAIHDAKASWDQSNEISTQFRVPWILRDDLVGANSSISTRLDGLARFETTEEERIQKLYAELNDEVYQLYGIPDSTRKIIEETLGQRPPEVLWPQMEGKSDDQKRMEHVWRLLSYAVKRVIESDEDSIVPFGGVAGEPGLVDRVRQELIVLFPGRDINQVEIEIVNELKKSVKGYRRSGALSDWLVNVFFEYHCSLYKNRPIFWHIASAQGTSAFAFGALVHYLRFDKNRMAKLRGTYLRDAVEEFRREAALADKERRTEDRMEWQVKVEEAQALDRKLQWIQEGYHEGPDGGDRDFRILTPWKEPEERPRGWDPDIDDGVKVNIAPFEKAGVLRVAKVT